MNPIMDGIPPELLGIGAGWLIVCLFVLAILRARLIPKATVDRMEAGYLRQIAAAEHDRDEWRTEGRLKDAQLAEKDTQLRHLKQVGLTVEQLARGLQREIGQ